MEAHLLADFYTIDAEAVCFFANHKIDGCYLRLPHQQQFVINASVLKACCFLKTSIEQKRKLDKKSFKGIMSLISEQAASFNHWLQQTHNVQHTLPSSERWFKDILKAFTGNDST